MVDSPDDTMFMRTIREFCVECHANFGIAVRSQYPNTCTDCLEKLRPASAGECEMCKQVIEIGDRYHLKWLKLCKPCAKQRGRADETTYACSSEGRR
jgi:hypothetical protein